MTLTGFRQGQRVTSLASPLNGEAFEAVIESVVVPKTGKPTGKRFVVIRDDAGRCYHRWFHEIEAIESMSEV